MKNYANVDYQNMLDFNRMWVSDDEDEEGSMINMYKPEFVIIKEKVRPTDVIYFLGDYDDSSCNTLLWCRKKTNAHTFSQYSDAERVLRWLESLKIKAKIEAL